MFDTSLGINIVETSRDTWIIGDVYSDKITGNVRITNPLGIKSEKIKETGSKETFALSLYTLSEFSSGEYIIIPLHEWLGMYKPKADLLQEYLRINGSINDIRVDYDSINMDEIVEDGFNPPDMNKFYGSDQERKAIDDFISFILGAASASIDELERLCDGEDETKESIENRKKIKSIRNRWLDKID